MTKIEWTHRPDTTGITWNPITGCTKISEGCKHCYAARMAKRLAGRCGYPTAPHEFDVTLHPDRLEQPLHWRKPRTVFVCSMSDLFHKDVPDGYIYRIFLKMAECQEHTFIVLTKRAERMAEWTIRNWSYLTQAWSMRNIWLGVTCENQQRADERIPLLLQCPAAVRFVSIEPMLAPVNLFPRFSIPTGAPKCTSCGRELRRYYLPNRYPSVQSPCPDCGEIAHSYDCALSWVICGGESGPGARPMHPDWARSVRDQCKAAGVPFFFKQWGAWLIYERVGKARAGHLLDGVEYHEWPTQANDGHD